MAENSALLDIFFDSKLNSSSCDIAAYVLNGEIRFTSLDLGVEYEDVIIIIIWILRES
jgi:hypothetical protein